MTRQLIEFDPVERMALVQGRDLLPQDVSMLDHVHLELDFPPDFHLFFDSPLLLFFLSCSVEEVHDRELRRTGRQIVLKNRGTSTRIQDLELLTSLGVVIIASAAQSRAE